MDQCQRNLSDSQIVMEFGNDDMKGCKTCPNLVYEDGMMTCKKISDKEKEKDQ